MDGMGLLKPSWVDLKAHSNFLASSLDLVSLLKVMEALRAVSRLTKSKEPPSTSSLKLAVGQKQIGKSKTTSEGVKRCNFPSV